MIRPLFVPFLMILFFSCERVLDKDDPLFYQISEADSTRLMNEILDEILFDARENQRIEDKFYDPTLIVCGVRNVFDVSINSRGNVRMRYEIDSANIVEKVLEYFMMNRNLSSEEAYSRSMDVNFVSFDFPFYNKFNTTEIEQRIVDAQKALDEMKIVKDVDSILVGYYVSKVDDWKFKLRALELIDKKWLTQISASARVHVEYQKKSIKSEEILRGVAMAFYQMRNYESLRYFNESYLNLFERSQRTKQESDLRKLDVLKVLHRAIIIIEDQKSRRMRALKFPESGPQAPVKL